MARHAGQNLEDLLRAAAPDGRPDSFAEGVVRAVRGRRRLRRVRWLAAGAAAGALIAFCYSTYVGPPVPGEAVATTEPPHPAERKVVDAAPAEEPPADEESFAVRLPPPGTARPRVLTARSNGTIVLFARPPGSRADGSKGKIRSPRSMAGSVSPDPAGPSFAIRFR